VQRPYCSCTQTTLKSSPLRTTLVSRNKFMFEAAQIPVFAKFLRSSRSCDLCNYVSNSVRAARENMRKLGRIVNDTLNIDDESWF
jgi:hypothetical protein